MGSHDDASRSLRSATGDVDAPESASDPTNSTTDPAAHLRQTPERCERCDEETPHRVRIRMVNESRTSENEKFAREPYRVATCERCGLERTTRMNSA